MFSVDANNLLQFEVNFVQNSPRTDNISIGIILKWHNFYATVAFILFF